jgi:hypothetical protein
MGLRHNSEPLLIHPRIRHDKTQNTVGLVRHALHTVLCERVVLHLNCATVVAHFASSFYNLDGFFSLTAVRFPLLN